jgi:hypothetical protein
LAFDPLVDVSDPDSAVPLGPFGAAMPINEINTIASEDDPSLTDDLLELYYSTQEAGPDQLYRLRRASVNDPWGARELITELSSGGNTNNPKVAGDGLTLYFASGTYAGRIGGADIFVSTRPDRNAAWGVPQLVPGINTINDDYEPWVVANGLAIYYTYEESAGESSLHVARRALTSEPFGPSEQLLSLDAAGYDGGAWVTEDELEVFFHTSRYGMRSIVRASRASTAEPFGTPEPFPDIDDPTAHEEDPWISPDRRTMAFARYMAGDRNIFIVTR